MLLPLCSRKPTFFLAFLEPKHNYLGNLMPYYDISNPAYFVRKLNEALAEAISGHANAHFFNLNELIALVGSARIQDDYTSALGHGAVMSNDHTDVSRIQPSRSPWEMWETLDPLIEFEKVLAQRFLDDLAIIRSPLQIKAIIVDVDDTLWRGIAVEELDKPHWDFTEGWPIGMAEALLFYKARGGLLAMCSKNDEAALRSRWPHIYQGRLRLADFAVTRINFERKSSNIREIVDTLNILPANVLFIDDNPREIGEVRSVFPDMHFLSADHHDWRRKILMLPKMQVAAINADAGLRTISIQANAARAKARTGLSFEDWLASLELIQRIEIVSSPNETRFERAFELMNKTNQFNTTGHRWERAEMEDFLASGGVLICSMLRDKMSDNGMVSVVAIEGNEIVQVVLSCRAFKYSVEIAAARVACQIISARYDEVRARIVDTGRNATCHGYFSRLGFEEHGGLWLGHDISAAPAHILVDASQRVLSLAV